MRNFRNLRRKDRHIFVDADESYGFLKRKTRPVTLFTTLVSMCWHYLDTGKPYRHNDIAEAFRALNAQRVLSGKPFDLELM